MNISFDSKDIAMPPLLPDRVSEWLAAVARSRGCDVLRLQYLFCDDEEILRVNREFLNHDYYTDIITFDYSASGRLAGDMVISLDTVGSNAAGLGESGRRELLRVIVHGLLHLCGINDKGPGEREIMEAAENAALSMISVDDMFENSDLK